VCEAGLLHPETSIERLAYERCVEELERDAIHAKNEHVRDEDVFVVSEATHNAKVSERRRRHRELQDYLREQVTAKTKALASRPKTSAGVVSSLDRQFADAPAVATTSTKAELKTKLQNQINERAAQSRALRKAMLEEERRFITKVNGDVAKTRLADRLKASSDTERIARSWRTDQHVNRLRSLCDRGPDALLSYVDATTTSAAASDDGDGDLLTEKKTKNNPGGALFPLNDEGKGAHLLCL